MTDDQLLHARPYDPARAHEYYMANRKLKGRLRGTQPERSSSRGRSARVSVASKPGQNKKVKSHYAQDVAALKKRLARLKDVLSQLVKEAKARNGDATPSPKKAASSSPSKGGSSSLTSTERKKAAKASAEYRKKHPPKSTPQEEVEALRKQIADIRAKIQEALDDARHPAQPRKSKTAPKGR